MNYLHKQSDQYYQDALDSYNNGNNTPNIYEHPQLLQTCSFSKTKFQRRTLSQGIFFVVIYVYFYRFHSKMRYQ
ncbi:unnamed protein product [Paramecium sonneborni]|uniref:Transmembrane protein n=1 Tax=Paramecium sonneborni TaxID=65129 RepID=A0A8S1M1F1_9CILI|nr:unnamed protein product [Paramecium sonneborni]